MDILKGLEKIGITVTLPKPPPENPNQQDLLILSGEHPNQQNPNKIPFYAPEGRKPRRKVTSSESMFR
jgi:hypothetical protein